MLRVLVCGVMSLAAAAVVAGAGCTRKNSEFCCTTADACARHGGDPEDKHPCSDPLKPYCDNEGQYGEGRTCIAPPGEPCGPDGECEDPDTPICLEGLCVECGDPGDCSFSAPVCGALDHQCESCTDESECTGFADRPYCAGGACVGCRDGGDCQAESAPVCDTAQGMCRGCRQGSECASDVCDWIGGGCVGEADVLYVASGAIGESCTREEPCGTVARAMEVAAGGRNWIHLATGDYQETVDVNGGTVRVVAEQGANLRPGGIDAPVFRVSGAADLRISGLRIHDADGNGDGPGDGVYCTNSGGSPTVVLDQVVIERNDDQGVDANTCILTVTRSVLRDNRRGGLALDSVDFDITNNFILANGSGSAVSAGVLIDKNPPSAGRLEHNTIVGNINPSGSPSGIQCVLVGSLLTFRNNIIYDNLGSDTQVDGDNCEHRYSVVGPDPLTGVENIDVRPTFVSDTDFHLADGSSGVDKAEASDIAIDFDGQLRPGGTANDIGADELP
jgi:hypothetical protein